MPKDIATKNIPYLPFIELDRIMDMMSVTTTHEPEWMNRTGTILILDNNPNTTQALCYRLTHNGHTVHCLEDSAEMFTCLTEHAIEILFIDYLTVQDCLLKLLSQLQENSLISYIPIIIIGSPENSMMISKIAEFGIGDYLARPLNPALLKIRVQMALEKKNAFEQRAIRLEKMRQTRHELEVAIQNLPDGFAIFDQNDFLIMHNRAFLNFYPHFENHELFKSGTLTFENFLKINQEEGLYLFHKGKNDQTVWIEEKILNFRQPTFQWEESLVNGKTLSMTTYRTPEGRSALIVKDISQDKLNHQDLVFLAYHDALTGLLNRESFQQKLNHALTRYPTSTDETLAILFLDLDGFKKINDSHGHEMGDWLLKQVGQRLRRCLRHHDSLARFGGDEFCILLTKITNFKKIESVALRILKIISKPFVRNNCVLKIQVSIGISIYAPGITSESLLQQADTAMYTVKQSHKNNFCFYHQIPKEGLSS